MSTAPIECTSTDAVDDEDDAHREVFENDGNDVCVVYEGQSHQQQQ
jgi:hypothetical protein